MDIVYDCAQGLPSPPEGEVLACEARVHYSPVIRDPLGVNPEVPGTSELHLNVESGL